LFPKWKARRPPGFPFGFAGCYSFVPLGLALLLPASFVLLGLALLLLASFVLLGLVTALLPSFVPRQVLELSEKENFEKTRFTLREWHFGQQDGSSAQPIPTRSSKVW
jgi:uncharacterized protein (DUF58 family)